MGWRWTRQTLMQMQMRKLRLRLRFWVWLKRLVHQENIRVVFGVFVSGNRIFERFVFVKAVFEDLCLWI
jgi:hypothetical protein